MVTANDSDNAKREISINVEARLQAIQQRMLGEEHEPGSEQMHGVSDDSISNDAYSELARAFELDIHDYAITEVNR